MRGTPRIACLLAVTLPACLGQEETVVDPCPPPQPVALDPAGRAHWHVVDSLELPGTPEAAETLALELYGEPGGFERNRLGQIIGIIASFGEYDLDAEANMLIEAGEILHLLDVQAFSLEHAEGVGVRVAHGVDTDGDPSDNFSGEESFALDPSRGEGFLRGRIATGHLSVELGTVPIAVTFPGLDAPFVIELAGARIEGEIFTDRIVGRIGGGIPAAEIDASLIPALAEGLTRIVERDCPGGVCAPGSFGDLLLDLFDRDADDVLSAQELRESDVLDALLDPDLDFFDEAGRFAPRCDDTNDSLSVVVGFHAVPAAPVGT